MAEMPELVKLHQAAAETGVRVELLSLDLITRQGKRSAEDVRVVLERIGAPLETLVFDGDFGPTAAHYGFGNSLPQSLVLDRDGQVVGRHIDGKLTLPKFEHLLERSLGAR